MNFIIKLSLFISKYKIDVLINTIMNIFIILGAIYACFIFKYKHETDIRKLYIDNCKKVEIVLSEFFHTGDIKPESQNILFEAYREAALYLHKDIVNLLGNIKKCIIRMEVLKYKLEPENDINKREILCNELYELDVKLSEYNNERIELYRKHIIKDGLDIKKLQNKFGKFFKNNKSKELNEI